MEEESTTKVRLVYLPPHSVCTALLCTSQSLLLEPVTHVLKMPKSWLTSCISKAFLYQHHGLQDVPSLKHPSPSGRPNPDKAPSLPTVSRLTQVPVWMFYLWNTLKYLNKPISTIFYIPWMKFPWQHPLPLQVFIHCQYSRSFCFALKKVLDSHDISFWKSSLVCRIFCPDIICTKWTWGNPWGYFWVSQIVLFHLHSTFCQYSPFLNLHVHQTSAAL